MCPPGHWPRVSGEVLGAQPPRLTHQARSSSSLLPGPSAEIGVSPCAPQSQPHPWPIHILPPYVIPFTLIRTRNQQAEKLPFSPCSVQGLCPMTQLSPSGPTDISVDGSCSQFSLPPLISAHAASLRDPALTLHPCVGFYESLTNVNLRPQIGTTGYLNV